MNSIQRDVDELDPKSYWIGAVSALLIVGIIELDVWILGDIHAEWWTYIAVAAVFFVMTYLEYRKDAKEAQAQ